MRRRRSDTQLDILVLDAGGAPARPWLTLVLDGHSRVIAGYCVFLGAPTALQTSLALRQAIWRKADPAWPVCGIPDILQVDHGGDFASRRLERVVADLGIGLVFSGVARPQGRGKVERFFGTLNTELLPELPGHLVEGRPETAKALPLSELDAAVGAYVTQTYNLRPQGEIGATPRDAWNAVAEDAERLRPLCLQPRIAKAISCARKCNYLGKRQNLPSELHRSRLSKEHPASCLG